MSCYLIWNGMIIPSVCGAKWERATQPVWMGLPTDRLPDDSEVVKSICNKQRVFNTAKIRS